MCTFPEVHETDPIVLHIQNKMAISDRILNFFGLYKQESCLDIYTSTPVEPGKHAVLTQWFFSPRLGQPRGGVPIPTMRKFSQTPQVRMCTKTIIDEITGIPYKIVPRPNFKDTFDEKKRDEVVEFFNCPNRNGESFEEIEKQLLKDILEIDAGVIIKTFSKDSFEAEKRIVYEYEKKDKKGNVTTVKDSYVVKALTKKAKLLEIYARDGGSFIVNPDRFGILPTDKPAYFQYSFIHPATTPLVFYKREIVYFKMNPRSNNPYGWSPVQSIFMILEALNNSVRYNKQFFEENAIPSGALSLIGANKDAFKRFMDNWKKNIKGKPHKMVIFNEDMKWTPFQMAARDMEWLNGQQFYQRIVWAMYGVTPDELGFTETSNRSVGQSQSRVFVRRAIKPYLQLLETKFTNEVISEFYDGEPEVELKYDFVDVHDENIRRTEEWNDVKNNIRTINEIRLGRGLEAVEWGDEKPNPSPSGGFTPFGNFGESQDLKSLKKKKDNPKIKPPDKVYKGYADFLEGYWKELEKEILKIFKEEQTELIKGKRIIVRKFFGSFMRRITHLFATTGLSLSILTYMNKEWNKGISDVEKELNLDIGVRENDRLRLEERARQQVDGYGLPDGKAWTGIKGANAQLQIKINDTVRNGIAEGKSADAIAKDIKGVFEVTTTKAVTIARTEGNNIRNEAHLQAYLRSGIPGDKKWDSHIDDRTSPICRELNNQIRPLTGVFETADGQQFMHPSAHPNCRSRITFLPDQ